MPSAETRDRLLFRHCHVTLDTGKGRNTYTERLAWMVGGRGKYSEFHHLEGFKGKGNFRNIEGLLLLPNGDVKKIKKESLKISSRARRGILFSDLYLAEWTLTNLEVGTIVFLEYEQTTAVARHFIPLYIQHSRYAVDEVHVTAEAGSDFMVTIKPYAAEGCVEMVNDRHAVGRELPVWEDRPYTGGFSDTATRVLIHYYPPGHPSSWQDEAEEYEELWSGVYQPTEGQSNTGTRDALATLLPEFEKTYRYVAVEIGEGGIIPHELEEIREYQYGDCKDLSLLLVDELIQRGYHAEPVLTSLPANRTFYPEYPEMFQFNHAIVGWIEDGDTLYHDPTGEEFQAGEIPWQLQGAPVLWMGEEGGLAWIPLDPDPLDISIQLNGTVDEDGVVQGRAVWRYDSRMRRELQDVLDDLDESDLNNRFVDEIDMTIVAWQTDPDSLTLQLEATLTGLIQPLGSRLLFRPFPFAVSSVPEAKEPGPDGFILPRPEASHGTIHLKLPWQVENQTIPADSLVNEVGTVSASFSVSDNTLTGRWFIARNKHKFSADKSHQLQVFLAAINDLSRKRVFLTTE
ncbi:hypothetical protein GF324_14515 [bacterium]|nr:hypothetical protein [bacterium]